MLLNVRLIRLHSGSTTSTSWNDDNRVITDILIRYIRGKRSRNHPEGYLAKKLSDLVYSIKRRNLVSRSHLATLPSHLYRPADQILWCPYQITSCCNSTGKTPLRWMSPSRTRSSRNTSISGSVRPLRGCTGGRWTLRRLMRREGEGEGFRGSEGGDPVRPGRRRV